MGTERPGYCPPVTVLICALNEEENLPHVLPRIPRWVDEVLLVDGHSRDHTIEVARSLRPGIRVVPQPDRGKGDALKYGVEEARGEIVVTLDADGETNPEDIGRFIAPLLEGFDFVKGTRLADGRPKRMVWYRYLGNKVLTTTANLLYRTKYTDICSGFNAFKRSAFQSLGLRRDGFEMEQEMLVKIKKSGLRVLEIAHEDRGRMGSVSKVSFLKQGLIDWLVIIRERFRG